MWPDLRKAVRWSVLVWLGLTMAFVARDVHNPNPAQRASVAQAYDLVAWEASNFLGKWVHKVQYLMPWNRLSEAERLDMVGEYFRLGEEAASLRARLSQAAADERQRGGSVKRLEDELARVGSLREALREDVEETMESAISAVVSEAGLGSTGGFLFPPVDIRLGAPPALLVTSPRDRIHRTHDVLLDAETSLEERERVEADLLEGYDLSALVIRIGGVATYPASIPDDRSLHSTLRTAAHEWLHHYFFFKPLGRNMFESDDMQRLNETAADVAGREIGDRAYRKLGRTIERDRYGHTPPHDVEPEFDFGAEMRETRRRVDDLLAEGRVEEAEAYMEERRRLFVENGIYLRKLNQAYFAFHGTYAESPSSVSPIGDQLRSFFDLSPDLGSFIREVSRASTYDDFLDRLARLEAGQPPSP